jgi:hypothetical protein
MIAMPVALTRICVITEPELIISVKWPMKERNTPMQNTGSDCSPHLMRGSKIGHFNPCQSFDTNRVTTSTATAKCGTRYGARFSLSFGLKASNSQVGNMCPKAGKRPAIVMTRAKIK